LKPSVLLLDEPAAGVTPADSHHMFEVIEALSKSIAVLIVEHDMKLVFRFAEIITVLVQGKVLMSGTPEQISNDPQVRDIYLGHRNHAWSDNGNCTHPRLRSAVGRLGPDASHR
jgi:branched-chain amino acid transport system ATP-binding protein